MSASARDVPLSRPSADSHFPPPSHSQEFLLSPADLGIPYSRPRYFCLAKLQPLQFAAQLPEGARLWEHRRPRGLVQPEPETPPGVRALRDYLVEDPAEDAAAALLLPAWQPVKGKRKAPGEAAAGPEAPPVQQQRQQETDGSSAVPQQQQQQQQQQETEGCSGSSGAAPQQQRQQQEMAGAGGSSGDPWAPFRLERFLTSSSNAYLTTDIVTPEGTRCACFTKSYSQ